MESSWRVPLSSKDSSALEIIVVTARGWDGLISRGTLGGVGPGRPGIAVARQR
jgi:hypothetical protein